jgi:hypothetical protein
MRYLTHDRSKVLLQGVDIDQSLVVAEIELKKGGWGSILGVWAIRDQNLTPAQALKVSNLYFAWIDSEKINFNRWHLTWAISDCYRNGYDSVKIILKNAYDDATKRARALGGLADKHVNGDKLYMGDAHSLGRLYAHKHVVVPGNPDYLQSAEEYINRREKK